LFELILARDEVILRGRYEALTLTNVSWNINLNRLDIYLVVRNRVDSLMNEMGNAISVLFIRVLLGPFSVYSLLSRDSKQTISVGQTQMCDLYI
jgi:hypothetical protein